MIKTMSLSDYFGLIFFYFFSPLHALATISLADDDGITAGTGGGGGGGGSEGSLVDVALNLAVIKMDYDDYDV